MNNNNPHTQGTGFVQGSVTGGNFRLNGGGKTYASSGNPKIIVLVMALLLPICEIVRKWRLRCTKEQPIITSL